MSFSRSFKRRKMLSEKGRTTCPKCHAKLIEKPGYGMVCEECGWWKGRAEMQRLEDEKAEKDYESMRGGSGRTMTPDDLGKGLDAIQRKLERVEQLESTCRQVSKALCGKENATLDELLQAADQLKSRIYQLEYALLLMVSQYCVEPDGTVSHLWMTAGEHAFEALGIENYETEENLELMIERLEAVQKKKD